MHEKLSQAVKLYDKLLTNQVSHPTWRRTSTEQAHTSTLPTGPTYVPNGYAQTHGLNGYNQWDSLPASSQALQSPVAQTFQPAYAPPPPPLSSTSGPSYTHPSYSYHPSTVEQEPQRHLTSPPVPPMSSPLLQPLRSPLQATQSYQPASILQAIPPTLVADTLAEAEGVASTIPPPLESLPQRVPTALPLALPSAVPPVNTIPDKSPIFRAHTISSRPLITSPLSLPQPQPLSLARSSTVSYASPSQAQPQLYSRQPTRTVQQPLHPPPPQPLNPTLPAFPIAPTTAPQAFDLYAPSAPTAPPQERREEMLIEL